MVAEKGRLSIELSAVKYAADARHSVRLPALLSKSDFVVSSPPKTKKATRWLCNLNWHRLETGKHW